MNDPIKMAHDLEEGETTLINFAKISASFYKTLIKEGVPGKLAEELTREWFRVTFGKRE